MRIKPITKEWSEAVSAALDVALMSLKAYQLTNRWCDEVTRKNHKEAVKILQELSDLSRRVLGKEKEVTNEPT